MRQLTLEDFDSFIAEKTVAVVHFDAEWDVGYRPQARRRMEQAAAVLGDDVNFAEVDVDDQVQLAKRFQLMSVPTVAYFHNGELIAALIGANQDVRARTERVLRGEPIGYKDGMTAGS